LAAGVNFDRLEGCKTLDMAAKKLAKAAAKETSRRFRDVVGVDTYEVWVRMLHELVPDGRTHRLAVVLAGMLQYAVAITDAKSAKEKREGSLVYSLLEASEATDPSEVEDLIHDAVVQLFKDARVRFERTNARGDKYSLADDSYEEFIHWFDMPWE
jgi:hypothetical protein